MDDTGGKHQRFQLVQRLFLLARARPPEEWPAFLAAHCAGDDAVRDEVLTMLTSPTADSFLDQPALRVEPRPERVGPYRVLDLLGEGGMGSVYKAEQRLPIRRTVAVKVVKPGFDSREVLARFESERQALARMDHPNIARVLDAGTDDRGRPYFVMEYVPGKPVTTFCDEHRLDIRQRLALFMEVCDAIQHAHTKAILHRDVKATNVLAYLHDGKPCVKVIDFGVAKALTSDRLTDATFATGSGTAIGTYEYMSPEQAEGSLDIDTRSDVYALGVLLYELLAGARPFSAAAAAATGARNELQRLIREVEPPRPSTRLGAMGADASRIAAARRQHLSELCRDLRRELEWIPLKALRKERDRRYDSAAELKRDVENYLSGRALIAAPERLGYRFEKGYRRNRSVVGPSTAITGIAAAHAWWPWFLALPPDAETVGTRQVVLCVGVVPWILVFFGVLQAALRITRIEPTFWRQFAYVVLMSVGLATPLALSARADATPFELFAVLSLASVLLLPCGVALLSQPWKRVVAAHLFTVMVTATMYCAVSWNARAYIDALDRRRGSASAPRGAAAGDGGWDPVISGPTINAIAARACSST